MKEKIITKELAKLYEKQGYLEDSLKCYISLYEQTNKQEFADAIENIKNKINPVENKSVDERPTGVWKKSSDNEPGHEGKDDSSSRALSLFEQWVNMIVLEKKIQNFKKIQAG